MNTNGLLSSTTTEPRAAAYARYLYERRINSDEYVERPDKPDTLAAARAVGAAVAEMFGEEQGHAFNVKNDTLIIEYGNLRERDGFYDGFRLALRWVNEQKEGWED